MFIVYTSKLCAIIKLSLYEEFLDMSYKEHKREYIAQYKKEKLKRIPLEVTLDKYDEIKQHADSRSESVNGFIKRAIDQTIKEDNDEG